jgi:hypothetical protein
MELAIAKHGHERRRRPVSVLAHDRAYDAHQLHLTGLDWTTIATRTGYASGRVAALGVDAYLQKIAVELAPEHRRQALQLELDRVDALQAAYWGMALAGDYHAAEVVLKVIARRCKILGFDKPDEKDAPVARTVVVGGTSEEYIAALQALIAEGEPRR